MINMSLIIITYFHFILQQYWPLDSVTLGVQD